MKLCSILNQEVCYESTEEVTKIFLNNSQNKKVCTYILKSNKNPNGKYILKTMRFQTKSKGEDLLMWIKYRPNISNEAFIWPVDCVMPPVNLTTQDMKDYMSLSCDNNYSDDSDEKISIAASCALVFPYYHDDSVENLSVLTENLKKSNKLNYENKDVLKYIAGILEVINKLNGSGYIFNEFHTSVFHPSRFYVKKNGSIVLDFSTLTTPEFLKSEYIKCDITDHDNYDYKNIYPLEFGDPFITKYGISGTKKPIELQKFTSTTKFSGLDKESQNFSLAAFLFYLMYGQMPYWGHLLAGENDNNIYDHYRIYREIYLPTPAFIFDDKDHIYNDMADYGYEGNVKRLWENSPQEIRDMFIKVLSWDNALRFVRPENPSAKDWLLLLNRNKIL